MESTVTTYKTLIEVGGKKYISLEEHEEIMSSVENLVRTVNNLKEAVVSLGTPVQSLVSSLNKKH